MITKNNKKFNKKDKPLESVILKNMMNDVYNNIEKFSFTKFGIEKGVLSLYNFKTHNSTDIKIKLLDMANTSINRFKSRNKLNLIINDTIIAHEMEKGIYEFSLIYVTSNKLAHHFIQNVYNDKLNELYDNLDPKNKHIKYDEFMAFVKGDILNCYFSAFLSPMQMFPSNWSSISDNIKRKEEVIYERKTTDRYKCSRCKQRKFYVFEMQMRSADEPSNFFYTCSVCCKTFIK